MRQLSPFRINGRWLTHLRHAWQWWHITRAVQNICIGESDIWIISLFLCHCSDIPVLVQIFWIFPCGLSGEAYSIWPAPSSCLSSHTCRVKQSKSEHPIGLGEKRECMSKMQPPKPLPNQVHPMSLRRSLHQAICGSVPWSYAVIHIKSWWIFPVSFLVCVFAFQSVVQWPQQASVANTSAGFKEAFHQTPLVTAGCTREHFII